MKKITLSMMMIMCFMMNSLSFAITDETIDNSQSIVEQEIYQEENVNDENSQEKIVQEDTTVQADESVQVDSTVTENEEQNSQVTPATKKILENTSKKDKKIAEYKEKYNDDVMANIAYWLDIVRLYSIPICIVGIAIGAFNFYIIGEKKLEKREKGFSSIMAFLCGLVFFQVLPLIFALLVAGR